MSNNQYTYRETYRREDDRDNNQGGWKSWLGLDDKNKDEYHYTRTVNRGGDDRDNHQGGGWKSWFGMDDNNKSRDNNDYHYAKTTTYRNTDSDSYPRSTNYSSDNYNRGNTGYSTSTYVRDSDRDTGYNRSYGNTDRDTSYTRTVDRGYTGGHPASYTGGYSSSDNYNRGTSGYTGGHTTGGYSTSSDNYNRGVNTGMSSSSYGPRGGYGYQTSSEYNRGGMSGNTGYSGDRDTTYVRSYTTDRDSGYSRDHPSSYETSRYSSGGYGGNTTSYGGGYGGNTSSYGDRDRYGGSSSFTTRSNY